MHFKQGLKSGYIGVMHFKQCTSYSVVARLVTRKVARLGVRKGVRKVAGKVTGKGARL